MIRNKDRKIWVKQGRGQASTAWNNLEKAIRDAYNASGGIPKQLRAMQYLIKAENPRYY
ncbi:MAG: hypothetical protein U0003_05725 [Vampirovibrionales bacterium]